ncbi:MAG: S4 domain-containing protein [Pseudolabrys sp.]|nr:S4 domain-containing protein [Pseudolabrys sp.]
MDRQRIDKWLWHARVVRTRTDATRFVNAGHVRRNGRRVSGAGDTVAIGDVLTLALNRAVRVLQVADFSDRRGDAAAARRLYQEPTAAETKALP